MFAEIIFNSFDCSSSLALSIASSCSLLFLFFAIWLRFAARWFSVPVNCNTSGGSSFLGMSIFPLMAAARRYYCEMVNPLFFAFTSMMHFSVSEHFSVSTWSFLTAFFGRPPLCFVKVFPVPMILLFIFLHLFPECDSMREMPPEQGACSFGMTKT